MRVRDEELVQFLLGEADQALRQRVEAALIADPQSSRRLEELRAALGLLDSLKLSPQPADDLVARTMLRIDAEADAAAHAPHTPRSSGSSSAAQPRRTSVAVTAPAIRSNRQFWDSAILSLSIVVICCLMLPLMLEARSQSRRVQCTHNLAAIGRGLTELAMMDSERRFPSIPISGPAAFAGNAVLRLHEAKLLDSTASLHCPSLRGSAADANCVMAIPTYAEFCRAPAHVQDYWRMHIGGDYAYNLGVLEDGRITAPRFDGRSHFAILGDAIQYLNDQEKFVAHEGRGFNIYYEDGHVSFIALKSVPLDRPPRSSVERAAQNDQLLSIRASLESADNPFRNTDGDCARGSHPGDSVVGPSASSPLPKRFSLR
jgi:hypothetical protein